MDDKQVSRKEISSQRVCLWWLVTTATKRDNPRPNQTDLTSLHEFTKARAD
jgi:hypothetical protein